MKASLIILVVMFVLFSCAGQAGKENSNSRVIDSEIGRLKINDVTIASETTGVGDTTLLFVHGWCINRDYWIKQHFHFYKKYKVISLDLPGFGESDKSRSEWSFEQYADDINEFIKKRKLKNVILIGHSMSGDILLLTDTKYPESVIGIVGVDNLQAPGTKHTEAQTKEIESFFAMLDSNFTGTVEGYTKQYLFPPSADTSIVNRVIRYSL